MPATFIQPEFRVEIDYDGATSADAACSSAAGACTGSTSARPDDPSAARATAA